MKTNTIITIGRQYGSGGKEIGHFVAEAFGIKLYDKEMLARAAKESGICEELFETHDEKPTNSFLYSLVMDTYSMGYAGNTYTEMPINHKVFLAQFDAIKKIADEGPCVLVGRCADYALESYPNVVSIFIRADMEDRIRRVATRLDLTDAKAKDLINKTDKKRASYYNYYTNKKWGEAASYELCLNSSELGVQGTAKAIEQYILLKESIEKEARNIVLYFTKLYSTCRLTASVFIDCCIMFLCCIDIFMPQNICDKINVSGFFIKCCSVSAAQFMWSYLLIRSDLPGVLLYHIFNSLNAHPFSLGRQEQCVFMTGEWY